MKKYLYLCGNFENMKRFLIGFLAVTGLMFSCTGNKAGQADETASDSVADSSQTAETDTLELLITETPMPRAADAAILRNQQIANILVETCPLLFSPTPNILNDIGRCCQSYIHISSLCAHIF